MIRRRRREWGAATAALLGALDDHGLYAVVLRDYCGGRWSPLGRARAALVAVRRWAGVYGLVLGGVDWAAIASELDAMADRPDD